MNVVSVTAANFKQEVLGSELPVLVEVSGGTPGCKTLAPRVDDVARELTGKLKVVRLNARQAPELVQALRVQALPTLIVVVGGQPVAQQEGVLTKGEILDMIEQFLPGAEHLVPAKELAKLLKTRQVVAVDIRDAVVFNRAHIPGAKNVPVDTVASAMAAMAQERKPLVIYDRSGGDDARQVFDMLTKRGLPAAMLKGGFLGWEAEGLDVARPD